MTTSPREPDAGDRRIELKPSDASAIADFAARVRTALGSDVVDIRLFGSKMTGQDVPDSDIDILVVVARRVPRSRTGSRRSRSDVNLARDVFISPTVVGQATLDDPVWRITPLLRAARAGKSV